MTKHHSESYRAGGIVVDPRCMALLLERNDGSGWMLPTAHRKQIEDPLVVAKEIVHKSVLGDLKIVEKLGTFERYSTVRGDSRHTTHVTLFLFDAALSENAIFTQWFAINKVAELLDHKEREFFESCLPRVQKFLKKRKIKTDQ